MEIVKYPHPALRYESRDVTQIDARLRSIVAEMFELMYQAKGIGLAGNQVALPLRLFVANLSGDPEDKAGEVVFINPQITKRKGSSIAEEGCLSLPELFAEVRRPETIVVDAFDLRGEGFRLELDELPGRVVQHEIDHLDGVLFTDRLTESLKKKVQPALEDFESAFREHQQQGELPDDDHLQKLLDTFQG